MVEKTDREIIIEVLNGNRDFFCFLVRKYERPIFNYIFRMVRSKPDAEDLAQDTFVGFFCFKYTMTHMNFQPGCGLL